MVGLPPKGWLVASVHQIRMTAAALLLTASGVVSAEVIRNLIKLPATLKSYDIESETFNVSYSGDAEWFATGAGTTTSFSGNVTASFSTRVPRDGRIFQARGGVFTIRGTFVDLGISDDLLLAGVVRPGAANGPTAGIAVGLLPLAGLLQGSFQHASWEMYPFVNDPGAGPIDLAQFEFSQRFSALSPSFDQFEVVHQVSEPWAMATLTSAVVLLVGVMTGRSRAPRERITFNGLHGRLVSTLDWR